MELLGDITKIIRNIIVVVIVAGLFFTFVPGLFTGLVDGLYASLIPEPTIERFHVSVDQNFERFDIAFKIGGDIGKVGEIKLERQYQNYLEPGFRWDVNKKELTAESEQDVKGIVGEDRWVRGSVGIYESNRKDGYLGKDKNLDPCEELGESPLKSVYIEKSGLHTFEILLYDSTDNELDKKKVELGFYDQDWIDLEPSVKDHNIAMLNEWIDVDEYPKKMERYSLSDNRDRSNCYLTDHNSCTSAMRYPDTMRQFLSGYRDGESMVAYLENIGRELDIIDEDLHSFDACFEDTGVLSKCNDASDLSKCNTIQIDELSKMLPALAIHSFKENFVEWRKSGSGELNAFSGGYPNNSHYVDLYRTISDSLKREDKRRPFTMHPGWTLKDTNPPDKREEEIRRYMDAMTTPAVSISKVEIKREEGTFPQNAAIPKHAYISWESVGTHRINDYTVYNCWQSVAIDLDYVTSDPAYHQKDGVSVYGGHVNENVQEIVSEEPLQGGYIDINQPDSTRKLVKKVHVYGRYIDGVLWECERRKVDKDDTTLILTSRNSESIYGQGGQGTYAFTIEPDTPIPSRLIERPGMHTFEIQMNVKDVCPQTNVNGACPIFKDVNLQKDTFKTGFYDDSYINRYGALFVFPDRDQRNPTNKERINVCVEKVNPTKSERDICDDDPNPTLGNLAECGKACNDEAELKKKLNNLGWKDLS